MNKTRQWSIFTAIAVLVVLAGGWLLLVSPQRSKAKDLDAQAVAAQQQVATLHAQLASLLAQKRNLPEQQRLLAKIATKIPSDPQEPALIRQLQGAAHSAGVDLSNLSPSAPSPVASTASAPTTGATGAAPSTAGSLYQVPVAITVSGSYFNVEMFEHSLEQLPRALLVNSLTVGPGDGNASTTSTTNPGDVTATINAMVFLSPKDQTSTTSVPTTSTAG